MRYENRVLEGDEDEKTLAATANQPTQKGPQGENE